MKGMYRAAGLAFLCVAGAFGCDGTEPNNNQNADSQRPSWWPDPPRPDGMPWPPPRPNDWDPEKPWPPSKEETEDVGWWIEHYGENVDPQTDERLKRSNQVGSGAFMRNFRQIFEGQNVAPGCGLFMLQVLDIRAVESCEPFPVMTARQVCARPFNDAVARDRCRALCQNNEKHCRLDDLFTPPIHGGWSCVPGNTANPGDVVNCDAYYLCNCWEE